MSDVKTRARPAPAYDADYYAWTHDQAARLRDLRPNSIDWENVSEEIESLGRSDRRAIGSALKVVLEHLIKWRFQAEKRSASWSDSIEEHRDRIERIVSDSPSLRSAAGESLALEYARARRKALRDTGLHPEAVPETCPFTAEQILDPDFWPDAEDT